MTLLYDLHHQVRRLDETLCNNGRKYSTGDVLFSDRGKRIILGKTIAEGGEGSVFAVHSESEASLVAKLYHSSQRVRWREQKLRLMCSRPIRSPCVAWPREILYDELRRFVGVLMPRADVVPLGAFAFHAEQLKKQFPSWPRYDLTRLCLNLPESVYALHCNGVVLGDLHPGNVMVSPDGFVCWVDADSFQIEDYPCSVGTERFRAPELRGNYGDFLRTRSHDTYSLSVLLFMTLTLGLSPFARQGGEGDMREAVELALAELDNRKRTYRAHGVEYYRPWLIVMTDGVPTSARHRELEKAEGSVEYINEETRQKACSSAWNTVKVYMASDEVASQMPLEVEVGLSVPVRGVIDLVQHDLTAVDYKSAAAKPDTGHAAFDHELQLVTYQMMIEEATGDTPPSLDLIYLVKTKTPQVIRIKMPPANEQRQQRVADLYKIAYEGITTERFHPQPGMQCTWCQYRKECAGWCRR